MTTTEGVDLGDQLTIWQAPAEKIHTLWGSCSYRMWLDFEIERLREGSVTRRFVVRAKGTRAGKRIALFEV